AQPLSRSLDTLLGVRTEPLLIHNAEHGREDRRGVGKARPGGGVGGRGGGVEAKGQAPPRQAEEPPGGEARELEGLPSAGSQEKAESAGAQVRPPDARGGTGAGGGGGG